MVRLGKLMVAVLAGGLIIAVPLATAIHAGDKKESEPVEKAALRVAESAEGGQVGEAVPKVGEEGAAETPAARMDELNKRIQVLLATAKTAESEGLPEVAKALRERAKLLADDLKEAAVAQLANGNACVPERATKCVGAGTDA